MKASRFAVPIAVAILWIRQVRYERRLSRRQGRWERETVRGLQHALDQHVADSTRNFEEITKLLGRWSKEVSRGFKELAGRPS